MHSIGLFGDENELNMSTRMSNDSVLFFLIDDEQMRKLISWFDSVLAYMLDLIIPLLLTLPTPVLSEWSYEKCFTDLHVE